MALILNIDTAVDTASVCVAKDAEILSFIKNDKPKDHASWLHIAIREIFIDAGLTIEETDAVAITAGPGSYTGLRIGMATAKGICYALNKPLITLNTLKVMAVAAVEEKAELLCPMIDARRMEVFTAIYNKELNVVRPPAALVLNDNSFEVELKKNTISFFGNGSVKLSALINNANAVFSNVIYDATSMTMLSEEKFKQQDFADLAYAEPLYLKEFFTPAGK